MINTAAMLGLGNDPAIQAIGNIGQGINTLAAMKERDVEMGRRNFKHEQEMDKRKIHDLKFVQEQEAATLVKYQRAMKDPQAAGLGALVAGAAMLGAISALANFKVPNFIGGMWDNLMDMLGLGGEATPEDRQEVEDAAETEGASVTTEGDLSNIQGAEDDDTSAISTGTPLPMPKGVSKGSPPGWRNHPISGGRKYHNGWDMPAPTGTPLTIKGNGKVVSMGSEGNTGYGKWITIKDSRGEHFYAHLSKYGKFKAGDSITTGDVVAYTGNSGGSTGPHLHWEFDSRTDKAGNRRKPKDVMDPIKYGYKWSTPFTGLQIGGMTGRDKSGSKGAPPAATYGEPHLIQVMNQAGITDKEERAMFLAQMSHESGKFKHKVEQNPGLKYNPGTKVGKKLGNTQPGDGPRYKGRGYIQLTGRWNYNHYGEKLGIDLVGKPELAAENDTAGKIAVMFWMDRVNRKAAQAGDVAGATKGINPKLNGLKDRQAKYDEYLKKGLQRGGPVSPVQQKFTGGLVNFIMQPKQHDNFHFYDHNFFVRQGRRATGTPLILVNNIVQSAVQQSAVEGGPVETPMNDNFPVSYMDISTVFNRFMSGIRV